MFFRALARVENTRNWVGVSILVLGLTGFSAVRYESLTEQNASDSPASSQLGLSEAGQDSFTDQFSIGLTQASIIILYWLIQIMLMAVIPLFAGHPPRFGKNLQVVVWASVPLGIMAGGQLIYYVAGGAAGAAGVSGVINELPGYADYPSALRTAARSLAEQLTVFWLWNLLLLYFGARYALTGKRWACLLVLIIWIPLAIFLPTVLGT
ncbi:MAG: hypothetical protein JXA10_13755 [Anaerolineae bacterium]|nr:hypothetical protein [Anaerolineae bacterium]